MKIKCLIIDDEPLAKDVIETYIQKVPELELIGTSDSPTEALQKIRSLQPDLIFLDIQMPELDGIQLLKSLPNPPKCIFTTAHSEFALDAFDLSATDYLLKPIALDRFLKAVNKIIEESAKQEKQESEYTFVKSDKKLIKIYFKDILYIEGLKDYVMIYTQEQRIITLQTMKNMEEKLPAKQFMRVHRSFIIALDKIKSISGNTVKIDSKEIPLGKNYKEQLMKIVEANNLIK